MEQHWVSTKKVLISSDTANVWEVRQEHIALEISFSVTKLRSFTECIQCTYVSCCDFILNHRHTCPASHWHPSFQHQGRTVHHSCPVRHWDQSGVRVCLTALQHMSATIPTLKWLKHSHCARNCGCLHSKPTSIFSHTKARPTSTINNCRDKPFCVTTTYEATIPSVKSVCINYTLNGTTCEQTHETWYSCTGHTSSWCELHW